jgi:hypothetical protein
MGDLRRCSYCLDLFPATTQYFFPRKNGTLYQRCQSCQTRHGKGRTDELRDSDPIAYRATQIVDALAQRAREGGFPCTLTALQIEAIYRRSPNCALCGLRFNYSRFEAGRQDAPSLDKVHPPSGYVPGNVEVLCIRCNSLKGHATAEEHRQIAEYQERCGLRTVNTTSKPGHL